MSRIGKKPVAIPGGVTAAVNGQEVKVKGPKGELQHVLVDDIIAKLDKGEIEIADARGHQGARAMWGMSRTHGRQPHRRRDGRLHQEARDHRRGLPGGGAGSQLQLQLGYSHDIIYPDPARHPGRSARSRPRSW